MGEQIFIFEMKENIKNFLELTENVKIEADLVEDWVGNRQKAQIKQEGYSNLKKNSSGFITFKISGVSRAGRQDRTMKANYLSYGMDLMDLMDGEGQLQEEIMREETEELYTIGKEFVKNKRNAKKQENVKAPVDDGVQNIEMSQDDNDISNDKVRRTEVNKSALMKKENNRGNSSKASPEASALKRPMKNKKKYVCEECNHVAGSNYNLVRHKEGVHEKMKNYSCEECGYTAQQKVTIKTHYRLKHTEEKKFECRQCKYAAQLKSTLDRHIKSVHDKAGKKNCELCDYKTSQNTDMQKHIKAVHMNFKDHVCKDCDFKTARKQKLNDHIKRKHEKE